MPIYPALTAGELELRLAEMMNDRVFSGTATAGGAATLTDSAMPHNVNDDERVLNSWIRIYAGIAAGDERLLITPYTASTGLMTASRNFSATPTTASKYYLSHLYQPTMYMRALQDAQQFQAQNLIDGLRVEGREIIVGNLVPNGGFDLYTTANVPDNLTKDTTSTFTMETTVTLGPRKALKMVTDGTNAGYLRAPLTGWGKFKGQTVRCYAMVRSSIAARTTLQFSDGVTATTDTVTTANVWELLEIGVAFGDAGTQAQVSVEVSAGAAVTVYIQFLYVPDPDAGYEYAALDADRLLLAIDGVRVSTGSVLSSNGRGYVFGDPLRSQNWSIVADTEDAPAKLRLNIEGAYRGHVLEYDGWKAHPEFTGPTISYAGQQQLILPRAYAFMLARAGADPAIVARAEARADDVEKKLRIKMEGNWRKVIS